MPWDEDGNWQPDPAALERLKEAQAAQRRINAKRKIAEAIEEEARIAEIQRVAALEFDDFMLDEPDPMEDFPDLDVPQPVPPPRPMFALNPGQFIANGVNPVAQINVPWQQFAPAPLQPRAGGRRGAQIRAPDPFAEEIMAQPMPFERTERTTRMPRFKVKYATGEEFKLRLENTIVTVNDDLVFVHKVRSFLGNNWGCDAIDSDGLRKAMVFEENGLNLRSPDPGYIQINDSVYHMRRRPARVYKQGLMSDNTVFRDVSTGGQFNLFNNLPLHFLLKALNERPVLHFDAKMLEGKKALRLSDRIAIITPNKKSKRTVVEHMGFDIGNLYGNVVLSDHVTMWAEQACERVGLTIKQK